MNPIHGLATMTGDDWVGIIAIVMALTLILGQGVTRGFRISRGAWPALIWMMLVWAGIIAVAALGFAHFRQGGM